MGVVLTFGALGTGTAQASTTAAGTAAAAAGLTAAAGVQGPTTPCNPGRYGCDYDSGWITYGDGTCEVLTAVGWAPAVPGYSPNELFVDVEVKSLYLFQSCTAYSTVYLSLADGPPVSFGPFWGFACAELDPTCSDPNTTSYTVTSGVPGSGVVAISVTDS
jgi:hypothetical protein